jgi:hypothetical protein
VIDFTAPNPKPGFGFINGGQDMPVAGLLSIVPESDRNYLLIHVSLPKEYFNSRPRLSIFTGLLGSSKRSKQRLTKRAFTII